MLCKVKRCRLCGYLENLNASGLITILTSLRRPGHDPLHETAEERNRERRISVGWAVFCRRLGEWTSPYRIMPLHDKSYIAFKEACRTHHAAHADKGRDDAVDPRGYELCVKRKAPKGKKIGAPDEREEYFDNK